MTHPLRIVNELAAVRRASKLQQADLAERAGVSRMTISRIESGHDPRLATFYEIARALNMEMILVPRHLHAEVERFIQSGGRVLGQPPGVGAPLSLVDLLAK